MKPKPLHTLVLLGLAAILTLPGGLLKAQTPDSPVSIVLKLVMPHIKPVNNINLPSFYFYFENKTDAFALFESSPYSPARTKRLRYILTDPQGNTHTITPVAKHHSFNDDEGHTVLYPGEKTKRIPHDIQKTLEAHFWEWWQDLLWKPGDYTLQIAYVPDENRSYGNPRMLHETVLSNVVAFTIHPTPQQLPEPDHAYKINKGLIRSKREEEKFHHIRYANAEGFITAERIYVTQEKTYTEPVFELVYDEAIPPVDSIHWRMVHKEILNGHGSQHLPYWFPTVPNEQLNGQARTWSYRESYSRKGRPLADVQYANGTLDGPSEIYLDGYHIVGYYKEGKRDGVWAVSRDSSIIFRAEFKDDQFHGNYWTTHHNSTVPWEAATYDHGKLHGIKETYYQNGQLREHLEYDQGGLSGLAIWYDETGKETAKGSYQEGKPQNGTFFPQFRGTVAGGGWKGPKLPLRYLHGSLQVEPEEPAKEEKRKRR